MEEWKECKLEEISKNITDGTHSTVIDDISGNYFLLSCKNVKNGIIQISNSERKINKGTFEKLRKRTKLEKDDILVTTVGTIGEMAIITDHNPHYEFQRSVGIIKPNKDIVDPKFLYYSLKNELPQIMNRTLGAVQQCLFLGDIKQLSIKLPPLPIQQKIATMLSSLDDKIELNNKINTNLEQQAQVLFKNWFVDFEPFGGKMPEGWKNGTLSDISTYSSDKIDVSDLTLSTYYSTENMLPNKMGIEDASSLPTIKQTTRCNPGETIISNIRPYFKKIYYCSKEIAGCSTDVLCFKPRNPNYSEYLYQTLYSDAFFAYMVLGSKGTKMPRGDKQQIMNYSITIPDEQYLLKYKTFAEPIFSQIDINRKENKRLSAIRDTLLPKLMNGKIEVNINEI